MPVLIAVGPKTGSGRFTIRRLGFCRGRACACLRLEEEEEEEDGSAARLRRRALAAAVAAAVLLDGARLPLRARTLLADDEREDFILRSAGMMTVSS